VPVVLILAGYVRGCDRRHIGTSVLVVMSALRLLGPGGSDPITREQILADAGQRMGRLPAVCGPNLLGPSRVRTLGGDTSARWQAPFTKQDVSLAAGELDAWNRVRRQG
jgi:hypothetical protein